MGVPAFFRWVINSCPQSVQEAFANLSSKAAQEGLNPTIDNLYLDMNGIIHPCTHPPPGMNIPHPRNEEEMFRNIRDYLDLVIGIVSPRRLVYFAIDGVAPKAKMNQQRARRFRAAFEIRKGQENRVRVATEMKAEGRTVPEELVHESRWDHNVITPGTEFLERVSNFLKAYITEKLSLDSAWRGLKVFFSDAGVPQEGEHKILEFIRGQRAEEGYSPHLRHCIYGADADLIMLGLSTHEPHFHVIRERIDAPKREAGGGADPFSTLGKREAAEGAAPTLNVGFNFVDISLIRQFLDSLCRELPLSFRYDLENVIDDFILLCFVVGNDFLPKVPGFSIRLGGIDVLLAYYKQRLPALSGYLTRQGELDLPNLEAFFKGLARSEFDLLRKVEEVSNRSRPRPPASSAAAVDLASPEALFRERVERLNNQPEEGGEVEFLFDQVENYKQNYYARKFGVCPADYECFVRQIRRSYIEGLAWNLRYYFQGCCSWRWFFPYFYAPLISDLCNFSAMEMEFEVGRPFSPFEQLLAVLPPYSAPALPEPLARLMLEEDSPIADFYPSSFYTDLKGKAFAWLGEVILPFVVDERLRAAAERQLPLVAEKHRARNEQGKVLLLAGPDSEEVVVFGELQPVETARIFTLSAFKPESAEAIAAFHFEHKPSREHVCQLLPDVQLPQKQFYYRGRVSALVNELIFIVVNEAGNDGPAVEFGY